MIVRILGEGQLDVPDTELQELNRLDDALQDAIQADDEQRFRDALAALLDRVRNVGVELPADSLVPSELVLPTPDASLLEVRELLSDEGLIPG